VRFSFEPHEPDEGDGEDDEGCEDGGGKESVDDVFNSFPHLILSISIVAAARALL
jgi:hypothetical protein